MIYGIAKDCHYGTLKMNYEVDTQLQVSQEGAKTLSVTMTTTARASKSMSFHTPFHVT